MLTEQQSQIMEMLVVWVLKKLTQIIANEIGAVEVEAALAQ